MAQIVKLRRSSVSGQKPTNSNLQLGELALNTTDGKVYMAKSGSLGPSVEELISTNTVNTGSIYVTDNVTASYFTGSFIGDGSGLTNIPYSGVTGLELNKITSGSVSASISPDRGLEINTDTTITGSLTITGSTTQIGNNTLLGTTLLSGSITISGSLNPSTPSVRIYGDLQTDGVIKFDPVSKNIDTSISASYLFVSSSTNDLYFSQNGNGFSNVTRLRWLEGNLYSGLLNGGEITASGTTFNIAAGSGIIVNLNASLTDNPYPTIKYVNWNTFTGQTLTYRTTHVQTFLAIDENADIVQTTSAFVSTQYNTLITLGTVIHQNLSTVNASITYPNVAYGYKQRSYDFLRAFGPLKLSGLNLVTTGSLGLNIGSGTAFADGRNYQNDPNNPSYITDSGTAVSKIFRYYQVSGNTYVQDTNSGAGYTGIDPTKYVLNGVLTDVGGAYSIQRVFWYPNSATKGIVVYYGNAIYNTAREAIDNINVETFNEIENTKQNAVLVGSIIIKGNGDFTNLNEYSVVPGGLFRSIGGSGGGGNIPTSRLFDLSDVDVTAQQDNDLLVYNVDTLKWEPTKSLEGDYTITGSLNVTGGLTGSIDFTNLTNKPTLVSGSSQINITGTTGYSTFSGSISASIGELSSSFSSSLSEVSSSISSSIDSLSGSIATTTNDLGGRLDSIEGVTGSYATTGSNQFNGDQSISGSVVIGSGSLDDISPEILHVGNSGSYNIARFDGFHNNYAQINIKNHHSGSGASTDFVLTADNGTETIHYVDLGINSSNYNAGYVGNENDAYLLNAGKDLYVGTIGGAGHTSNLNLFAQNKWETPQIHVSGSGQVGFNTTNVTDGYEYEFSGSIKAIHSLDVIGSVSGSVFTGSYIGDGFGLYNIPASGVTGLELFKITSGSVSASISPDRGLEVNTDVYIDGILTAKELHIDYVTSSVLYQSGSTKFGDTLDDNHNFTGSVNITGSLYLNGTIVGTGKLDETTFESYTSSINPRISALETESGSIRSDFNTFTSSYTTGAFTGSFNGDATDLINVPFYISGSNISGTTVGKTFTKLQFDDSTGLNVDETEPGTAFISIGSHFKDIFVSGSDILSATGSDAFEVIPEGGIDITTSITDTNGNGYIKELKFSTLNLSSSLDSRIEDISGSLDTLSTTVVLTSQTGSMSVLSASFAATAAFALNAGGGVEGKSAKLTQSISASTWTFDHFLGERYPNVTVYDSNDQVVVPTYIEATSDTQLVIYFSIAQTGTAVATIGGGLPAISGSYEGRVLSVVGGAANWKENIVSGSLQIEEFGYAITGSNTFVGDQTIAGTLSILDSVIKHETTPTLTVGTNLVTEVAASVYDAAFFDYVVKDGTNMRAGTVMSVSNGSIVKYNETTTNDIGDTSPVTLSVTLGSGNIKLMATITSGTWTFSSLTRGI